MRILFIFSSLGIFLLFLAVPVQAEVKIIPANALTLINEESPAAASEDTGPVKLLTVPIEPAEDAVRAPQAKDSFETMEVVEPQPPAVVPAPEVKIDKAGPVVVDRSAFSRLKNLVGKWEGSGMAQAHHPDEKIEVEYRLTAGGNAVMEILFPGTPQEMTTVYYESNNNLMLTHYCMLGNRPNMELKSQQANVYEFDFIASAGINPSIDTHMHKLKISFIDASHMNQEWTMFEAGKAAGSHSFQLTRVPAL